MITKIQLQNLGTANKNRVVIKTKKNDEFILYFSYETLVGFEYWVEMENGEGGMWHKKRVCQNEWSATTDKLLNEIEPDKKKRVKGEQFENEVGEMLIFLNKACQ